MAEKGRGDEGGVDKTQLESANNSSSLVACSYYRATPRSLRASHTVCLGGKPGGQRAKSLSVFSARGEEITNNTGVEEDVKV